jgi:hypothetical protein
MPNEKTDSNGYNTVNEDKERDAAAKGGPATSLGNPDDKHGISAPYDSDLQTQIASKGAKDDKPADSRKK